MGDSFFPKATLRPEPEHAVDELVRRINESPGELTLLAQAPLTNIATAVVRDPSIAQKVKRLYIMGGGDRQHHAGRGVQLLRRSRGREDRLQGRLPDHALHVDADALARRLLRRRPRADRGGRHAARALLPAGDPQGGGVRARRWACRARRIPTRWSRAAIVEPSLVRATARGVRRRRDPGRADARLQLDRRTRHDRPGAELHARRGLRHRRASSSSSSRILR